MATARDRHHAASYSYPLDVVRTAALEADLVAELSEGVDDLTPFWAEGDEDEDFVLVNGEWLPVHSGKSWCPHCPAQCVAS